MTFSQSGHGESETDEATVLVPPPPPDTWGDVLSVAAEMVRCTGIPDEAVDAVHPVLVRWAMRLRTAIDTSNDHGHRMAYQAQQRALRRAVAVIPTEQQERNG